MRRDQPSECPRYDARDDAVARDGRAVPHVEMRAALVALRDEAFLEHPAQFGEHRGVCEVFVLGQSAMQVGYRQRAMRPQVLEDRGLAASQNLSEVGFLSRAHGVDVAKGSILQSLVRYCESRLLDRACFVVSVVRPHRAACPERCPVLSLAATPPAGG